MRARRLCLAAAALWSWSASAQSPTVTDYPPRGWSDVEAGCSDAQRQAPQASSIGCYRGFSAQRYRSAERTSRYVALPDGTRVAVDVFRPVVDGKVVEGPLPTIFLYARYWRAYEKSGGVTQTVMGDVPTGQRIFDLDRALSSNHSSNAGGNALLLSRGYVVVRAEARGTGASFGVRNGDMSGIEAEDGKDLIEWITRQPWSNGKVGMVGFSYPGMSQLLVASRHPRGLVSIMPAMATFDEYRASWAGGGVLRKYGLAWLAREAQQQKVQVGVAGSAINPVRPNVPQPGRVDEDPAGAHRGQALASRSSDPDAIDPTVYFTRQSPEARELVERVGQALGTTDPATVMETLYSTDRLAALLASHPGLGDQLRALRFPRDGSPMMRAAQTSGPNNLAMLAPAIRNSGIAVYNWGGWRDFATLDTLLWDANLSGPKKLLMGPWAHGPNDPADRRERASAALLQIEQLRWADYWLKGIDNGIMREPAVTLGVWDEGDAFDWATADKYPIPSAINCDWNLTPSGGLDQARTATGRRAFTVDFNSTTGERTRYHGVFGNGPHAYPDLAAHAAKGALSFTSASFEDEVTLVGSPVVTLRVTASTPDATIHGYLERIERDGRITLLTDGVIRAAHRTLGNAPYRNLGLPFSDSRRSVLAKTPGLSPVRHDTIVFDLQPLAVRFKAGSRVRLVITGADAHSNLVIPHLPPTRLTIHAPGSRLRLPIIAAGASQ